MAAGALSAVGIGSGTVFGVSAKVAFAIGALAYIFTSFVVAPFLGVEMDGIEFNPEPTHVPKPQKTPRHPAQIIVKSLLKSSSYSKILNIK